MSLNIKKSDFVKSASKPSQYPLSSYPEFFFAGKSNSGKSSMLNAICNRKKLARTSKTPGRTQLINFFLSSFHVDYFNEFYGNYFDNIEIVYDPIDTSVFYRSDDEKEYDIVYCGSLHPLKGLQNLLDFSKRNRNRKVSIFGWGDPQITQSITDFCNEYKNVEFFGTKSQKEISEILRKCNAIFHSPVVNEPFCRMIAEGLICGCKNVIGRPNKIGSYLEFENVGYDEFKEKCQNASSIFWDKIQSKHENNCSS